MISLLSTLPPESELNKLLALLNDAPAVTRRMVELAKAQASADAARAEAAKVTEQVAAVRSKLDADSAAAAALMDKAIALMRTAEESERQLRSREEVHTRAVAAFTRRSNELQEQLRRRVAEHAQREEALLERQQVVAEQQGRVARQRAEMEAKMRKLRAIA
jgi:DNA repair exonuclease SbcCD ATPase subunit